MIIWLNGAFGAGKTQTAWTLHKRLPCSFVYDPENTGYFIRNNMPRTMHTEDFQDIELWRTFNYDMLKKINNEFKGIIIAPMTITKIQYYEEIIGRLRKNDVCVHHYVLAAKKETLKKRLRTRLEFNTWPVQQIDRCIKAFENNLFENKIDTDCLSVSETAEKIAEAERLTLSPGKNRIWSWLDRKRVQIKHIR